MDMVDNEVKVIIVRTPTRPNGYHPVYLFLELEYIPHRLPIWDISGEGEDMMASSGVCGLETTKHVRYSWALYNNKRSKTWTRLHVNIIRHIYDTRCILDVSVICWAMDMIVTAVVQCREKVRLLHVGMLSQEKWTPDRTTSCVV